MSFCDGHIYRSIGDIKLTDAQTIINPPIVVEPFEAQTILDPPIVVKPIEAQTIIDPPIVVEPIEGQTIIDPPIVVEPIEGQTIIDPPIVVEPNKAQTIINPPIVVEHIERQTFVTSLPDGEQNESEIWLINYGKELLGHVTSDQEIECHYYNIHTALVNTFLNDSYAILILEGYMMALIKQTEYFCLCDSHARDLFRMPDPNGTAVVMKFKSILDLEQYLYSVSTKLHTNLFEIVPLQLNKHTASKTIAKCIRDAHKKLKVLKLLAFKRLLTIKREGSQRKLTARNKVDLKNIQSLKKETFSTN